MMHVHQQFNHFGSVRYLWSTIFISTIILLLLLLLVVDISPVQAFVPSIGTKTNNPTRYEQQQNQKVLFMSIPNPIDTVTSGLVSICRLPGGVTVKDGKTIHDLAETERPIIKVLYDIENSLPCRKVREVITEFDLVVENIVPAGPNSQVFTNPNYQYSLEPNAEIPRMIIVEENDTSTERTIVGTDNILEYFNTKFQLLQDTSNDDDTTKQIINVLREVGGYIGTILRIGRGTDIAPTAIGAPRPMKPLILYSYEGNQFCRLVREVLMELDIIYELRSTGKGSVRRKELASITGGSTQCPYLIDPNTDTAMSESKDIIQYLYKFHILN